MKELEKIKAADLNMSMCQYIGVIGGFDQPTFTDLAGALGLSKPAVTAIVNKLILSGYVRKEQSDQDKRVFFVCLTPKGRTIADVLKQVHIDFVTTIRKSLSDSEYRQLVMLLEKIIC